MIVSIITHWGKWKPGDRVDVTPEKARELMILNVAKKSDDQSRLESKPKVEAKEDTQKIEVHNHYYITNPDEPDNSEFSL